MSKAEGGSGDGSDGGEGERERVVIFGFQVSFPKARKFLVNWVVGQDIVIQ